MKRSRPTLVWHGLHHDLPLDGIDAAFVPYRDGALYDFEESGIAHHTDGTWEVFFGGYSHEADLPTCEAAIERFHEGVR